MDMPLSSPRLDDTLGLSDTLSDASWWGGGDAAAATRAVHAGETPQMGGGLSLAMDPSVAFALPVGAAIPQDARYYYARTAHPTGQACAEVLAALEGAEACLLTNSGMAAISATLLALLRLGDHVIAPCSLYSATRTLLEGHLGQYGVSVTFVDGRNAGAYAAACRPETRVAWVETPSNPLLHLTDFEAVSEWARAAGVLTIADNTFASPVGSRPLEYGIDVVIHSATKYLSGHGDLLAGAILTRRELAERIAPWVTILGSGLCAHGAWQLRRGLATFPLRMGRHCESALRIAQALQENPAIAAVHYPGLPSHPQHDLARRQMPGGCGGVVSFEVDPALDAVSVVRNTRLCTPAFSLGEPRTLIAHPETMHYAAFPPEERRAMGITRSLIRLAVGLEDPADILRDIEQAIAAAVSAPALPEKAALTS
jgi:Cystathionine beta-lyases/cystathionine gamma-synthases